jgi:hypothetical protein
VVKGYPTFFETVAALPGGFGVRGRVPANFQSTAPWRARPSLDFSGDGRNLAISTLVVIGEESPFFA